MEYAIPHLKGFYDTIYSKNMDVVLKDENNVVEETLSNEYITNSDIEKYVFVYGTLMKNQRNHEYLNHSIYIGDGVIDGYQMYDLGTYPGIVEGKGTVFGEVYQITKETENRLDYLEDEGNLYLKKLVVVRLNNNQTVIAMVYVYNQTVSGLKMLEGKYNMDC